MRIGLITADVGNSMPNVGDYFITRAVELCLIDHYLLRIPMHRAPSVELREQIAKLDLLIVCGTNIVGVGGSVRFGISADWLRSLGKPVLPLGLGSQADLGEIPQIDAEGSSLLEYWFESTGPISVRDELTRIAVEKILGEGSTVLTGCPSLLLRSQTFSFPKEVTTYCSGPFHYRPREISWKRYHELTSQLYQQVESPLYLAQQPSDLLYPGTSPGPSTLHCPSDPELHLKALISSLSVLSWRIHPCLMAITHDVPAYLVAIDERTKSLAQSVGLPYETISSQSVAEEIAGRFEEIRSHYPWENIRSRLEGLRKQLSGHLREHHLISFSRPQSKPTGDFYFCSIVDSQFLGSLIGLIENLRAVGTGNLHCHCLVLEGNCRQTLQRLYPDVRWYFSDLASLWTDEELKVVSSRSREVQAYSSKARLLRRALSETPIPLCFVDVDLFFYHSPQKLGAQLSEDKTVLLFPHWNDVRENSRQHGVFNSGLLVVKPGAERFLDWWAGAILQACGTKSGEYYEQGYLDLAPALFREVDVYRGGDQNVAAWNEGILGVQVSETEPWIPRMVDGRPLNSFHAAVPDTLGIYESKFAWDQTAALFSNDRGVLGSDLLYAHCILQQRRHWSALDRAVFLFETLRNRLGLPVEKLSSFWMDWWVRGPGIHFTAWTAKWYGRLRAVCRKLGIVAKTPNYEPSPWVRLNRRAGEVLIENSNQISPEGVRGFNPSGLTGEVDENSTGFRANSVLLKEGDRSDLGVH
jgi:hypothetical protein